MPTEALPWDLQRYRAGLRQRYGGSRPGMSTGRAIACPRPWEPERSSEDRLVDGAWTVLDRSRRITRTLEVHDRKFATEPVEQQAGEPANGFQQRSPSTAPQGSPRRSSMAST